MIICDSAPYLLAKSIRSQYPGSVIGFLGNSFAICAVADRFMLADRSERYIIPFSGNYLLRKYSLEKSDKSLGYYYQFNRHRSNDYYIDQHLDFIAKSSVSPQQIISKKRHLTIVDRACTGEGIVSYGYLWSCVAHSQGYTPTQIKESLHLCPIFYENPRKNISCNVVDQDNQSVNFSSIFKPLSALSENIPREALEFDNSHGNDLRIAPRRSISKIDDYNGSDFQTCYNNLLKLYTCFERNNTDVIQCKASDISDLPISKTAERSVSSLIIQ